MTQKERMLAGQLYVADDPELVNDAAHTAGRLDRYNRASTATAAACHVLLVEAIGYNIQLGEGAFLNFGCIVLDVVSVRIGAGTQVGPGVQILTADHPRDPAMRCQMLEFGRPVTIGRNVWIGGAALILSGITVGNDAIVGAGSVVSRDVPAGVTVAGNPARTLRWGSNSLYTPDFAQI